ncbi:unnamed protein product [Microthlaspi erraticum]|uniref:Uncharacterized protein n=1 Tax=Microthlaspi erraticum TaxID=1685480 RepID=A0A6D2HNZ8_9BRAS|nr:unnamed protein product [Microthlaspi erraticum]
MFRGIEDLIDAYNLEKLRLDILKEKQKRVEEAFLGSFERFRLVHMKDIQLRSELVEADAEVEKGEAETLEAGAASRESKAEMAASVQLLKDIGDAMIDKWKMEQRKL